MIIYNDYLNDNSPSLMTATSVGCQHHRTLAAGCPELQHCTAKLDQIIIISIHQGKGVQTWKKTGCRYDGDWREGKRHGFGMLSVIRDGQPMKEYTGGWKHDKKHVRTCTYMYMRHAHAHTVYTCTVHVSP